MDELTFHEPDATPEPAARSYLSEPAQRRDKLNDGVLLEQVLYADWL